MYNPYDLLPSEYDNAVFPELYKKYDYTEYDKETERLNKRKVERKKKMGKFNEKKVASITNPTAGVIKVVLVDGTHIEGSLVNVTRTLGALGFDTTHLFDTNVWYYSDSRGWVAIQEMATPHIKNAIVKRYEEWLVQLKALSPREMAKALVNGPDALAGLVAELSGRND
jgi:hypothetical protein